jgi:hypothetical protein
VLADVIVCYGHSRCGVLRRMGIARAAGRCVCTCNTEVEDPGQQQSTTLLILILLLLLLLLLLAPLLTAALLVITSGGA